MNESTAMEQGSFLERKTPQRDNRMYLLPENGFPMIKNRTGFENILRPAFPLGGLMQKGIDMTRIGNWWSWISRLLALGMGVLWMTLGINRLINNAGGILGFMDIGSGITMVIVPFTTVRCSNCGKPTPYERFYFSTYLQNKFICSDCHTRYKLPVWHTFYLYIILLGLAVAALFGPDIHWHGLGTNAILSEGWFFFCALELLLVHILHYAKLDRV